MRWASMGSPLGSVPSSLPDDGNIRLLGVTVKRGTPKRRVFCSRFREFTA